MSKIRPLFDQLFIRRKEPEAKTKGGIHIPDVARERQCQGTVVAAGAGSFNDAGVRIPMEVQVGDEVLVGRYDGREVEVDGEKLLIVRQGEVLGVIEG